MTLTSAALQVTQVLAITDARGEYQFVELPPGAYRVEYEVTGFAKLVREEIRLTTGFAARVDVVLKVASVAETVVVSGASPLVDVTNTRGGTTVSKELLASTPNSGNYQDMYLLVGGVQVLGAPMTGESGLRPLQANMRPVTYGQGGIRGSHTLDGVLVEPNDNPDFASFEEVDVKTFGNTAEVCCPGEATSLIVKAGGNDFHGRYRETVQNRRFQSKNVDSALMAQGITTGSGIKYYNDFSGDLGGRIIRNTLWFYGAFHDLRNERTAPGFASGPGQDGAYGTLDDVVAGLPGTTRNYTGKVSYQATARHKVTGLFSRAPGIDHASSGSRFVPLETTEILSQTNRAMKVEWQGSLTPRLLASMMVANGGLIARRQIQDVALAIPNHFDRETSFQTGASWNDLIGYRSFYRKQWTGNVHYYPGRSMLGSHDLTAGSTLVWGDSRVQFPDQQTGNYRLVFDRAGGLAHQPAELWTHNYPVDGLSIQNGFAAYSDRCMAADETAHHQRRPAPRAKRRLCTASDEGSGPVRDGGRFPSSRYRHVDAGGATPWCRARPHGDGRPSSRGHMVCTTMTGRTTSP